MGGLNRRATQGQHNKPTTYYSINLNAEDKQEEKMLHLTSAYRLEVWQFLSFICHIFFL